MMANAAVFFRERDVVVHSQHRTHGGLLIAGAPAFGVAHAEVVVRLAEVVRSALARSLSGVASPTDWKEVLAPVLEAARVTSWNALVRSSKLCHVLGDHESLTVVPTRNGGVAGPERGFHEYREMGLCISVGATDAELLEMLIKGEALCEPR